MPYSEFPPLDKKKTPTQPIRKRVSIVSSQDFARPLAKKAGLKQFFDHLPKILAGRDFLELKERLLQARQRKKPIILAMGAHVIKVGLSPVINQLLSEGWISAIAVNGAFMIHDVEIAMTGKTSEDVAARLHQGKFGTAAETGSWIASSLIDGRAGGMGVGEAIGSFLDRAGGAFASYSVIHQAFSLKIPVTVHSAIGTDFIHFHPEFNGAILGELSERDFFIFAGICSKLNGGGVFISAGSAVIIPEVFLKAVSLCIAQGHPLNEFYTAVFDFNRQYRSMENIIKRPVANGGKGYYFVGHHELMIPLLAAALLNS